MYLVPERFIFGGDDRGFLKEVVKTYLMAPRSLLNSPSFLSVFKSLVYGYDLIVSLTRLWRASRESVDPRIGKK
jgi:hypothetical protein